MYFIKRYLLSFNNLMIKKNTIYKMNKIINIFTKINNPNLPSERDPQTLTLRFNFSISETPSLLIDDELIPK